MMRPVRTCREFGAAIRQARKDRGMTQTVSAAKAQVSRPWLSELETGSGPPIWAGR